MYIVKEEIEFPWAGHSGGKCKYCHDDNRPLAYHVIRKIFLCGKNTCQYKYRQEYGVLKNAV